MEKSFVEDICVYKERPIPEGSVVCDEDRCLECAAGNWMKVEEMASVPRRVHAEPEAISSKDR